MKFTAGPWEYSVTIQTFPDPLTGRIIESRNDWVRAGEFNAPIAMVFGSTKASQDSRRADGFLMAAAPDLYEALNHLIETASHLRGKDHPEIVHAAQMGQLAIKKANGER